MRRIAIACVVSLSIAACEGVDPGAATDASSPTDAPAAEVIVDGADGDVGDVTADVIGDAAEAGACQPGIEETEACGQCGKRTRTCDPRGQFRDWGLCLGEGACAPGGAQSSTEGCGSGEEKRRSCGDDCSWSTWSSCTRTSECTQGASEVEPCGRCGSRERRCQNGAWGAWSSCGGEGVCATGERRETACGRCGKRVDVCSSACAWGIAACAGEGVCAPGATDTTTAGCAAGEERARQCSASCTWTDAACKPRPCAEGAKESKACGACGTSTRTCSGGAFGAWSACSGEGACTPGATRTVACTGGGSRTDSCSNACAWTTGTCPAPTAKRFVDLWSGGDANYAKASDGRVFGWGNGAGNVMRSTSKGDVTTPTALAHLGVQIVGAHIRAFGGSGLGRACVVTTDGLLRCVGDNEGHLGPTATVAAVTSFTTVAGSQGTTGVAGSWDVLCSARNGGVVCWGDKAEPAGVGRLTDVRQLSIGYARCALRGNGTVFCWGAATGGGAIDAGTPVTGLTDAVEIAAGSGHACARRATGAVVCWGNASYGALGNGDRTVDRTAPVSVLDLEGRAPLSGAVSIASGPNHVCAVLSSGRVVCWGSGAAGRLGEGKTLMRARPIEVTGLTTATKVACGEEHSCALLADGAIACWGDNAHGQLGVGAPNDSYVPVTFRVPEG